jgi:hypothetical protein
MKIGACSFLRTDAQTWADWRALIGENPDRPEQKKGRVSAAVTERARVEDNAH